MAKPRPRSKPRRDLPVMFERELPKGGYGEKAAAAVVRPKAKPVRR